MRYAFFPLMIFVLAALTAGSVRAAELDSASQESLFKTKALLKSAPERDKAIQANPSAQNIDQMVKSVGGTAQTREEIYGLSAEVFEKLTRESGGDALKMQEILAKAKDDPKAFYEQYFSAADKAKLSEMSRSIGSAPTVAPAGAAKK